MSEHPQISARTAHLIGRVTALIFLAFALIYGVSGSFIEYAFSSDPLGPRVFPVALALVLAVLAVIYFFSPGAAEGFPTGGLLLRVLGIPALLVVSTLLLEPLGFAASIFIMTFGTALIFEARFRTALVGAIGHAILWWLVFGYLLEVYLPKGALFGG